MHFLGKTQSLPCFILYSKAKFAYYSRCFLTSYSCIPVRDEQPHVQGAVAARVQEGLEELSHIEGQEGQREEIPLIQGKEQWLRFAEAAVKRYPMSKV